MSFPAPPLAINNHDVADFVDNLFLVYIIIIFIRILSTWFPRRPQNEVLNGILTFCEQATDPYLNIFRSFIKPIGGGGFSLDLSPIIAVIVLLVAQGVIVGAIDSA